MNERPETVSFWHGRLPHWEVADGRYFVTMRLAGAIPRAGLRRIAFLVQQLDAAVRNGQSAHELQREILRTMEDCLDRAPHVRHLTVPDVAQMVIDAITHRRENGIWEVYEYVLMPNHIHLFLKVLKGTLRESMVSFKTWTGTQAARLIRLERGKFWQDEWFDHWSRSLEEDDGIQSYIYENPVKAGLVPDPHDWPYGSRTAR